MAALIFGARQSDVQRDVWDLMFGVEASRALSLEVGGGRARLTSFLFGVFLWFFLLGLWLNLLKTTIESRDKRQGPRTLPFFVFSTVSVTS